MLVADVSENPSDPASLEKSIWSTSRGLRSPMSDATSSSLSCRAIGPSDTKTRESEPACTIGRKVSSKKGPPDFPAILAADLIMAWVLGRFYDHGAEIESITIDETKIPLSKSGKMRKIIRRKIKKERRR
jgi:hypothetical protein